MTGARLTVRVQREAFSLSETVDALTAGDTRIGAVVSFVGLVRDFNDAPDGPQDNGSTEGVTAMRLEHYPGMTEKSLKNIAQEAAERWPLFGLSIVHRVGELSPGDPIVLTAATSAHRADAFEACAFVMDYLKTRAPFWKCEQSGTHTRWVSSCHSDDKATKRWSECRATGPDDQ